ncbi:MAG: FAD-dependent oxidoreductase, partial [Candidatus Binataceae bacterium]
FGWDASRPAFDWLKLIANKNQEIARLNGVYEKLLTGVGVEIIRGRAEIVNPHTVVIDGRRISTEYILAATGSWPIKPMIPGAESAITSNEAFFLDRMPRRVAIVGGGYIAVEFAGIFHGLGAAVTLIHRGAQLLRGFDDDLRAALAEELRKRSFDLRFGVVVERLEQLGDGMRAHLSDGGAVEADLVMFATGRHPNSHGLGLEDAGVALDVAGAVIVDGYSRSSIPSIYAIGDLTNRKNLTPVAIAEGHAVADSLFGGRPRAIDFNNVPSAVFSQPPIATVGLTEAQARVRFGAVDIYKSAFKPLKHTLSGRDERALMKLVVERAGGRVVGAHMLGPDAGEIIQGLAIALKCGATKAQFDATIGIHPTAAEEFVTMRTKSEA